MNIWADKLLSDNGEIYIITYYFDNEIMQLIWILREL